MASDKVLVIGYDGANKSTILNGINNGDLPNMKHIVEKGSISTLKAPIPPLTPSSTASILTGFYPGKHSIYGFEEGSDTVDKSKKYVDYKSIETETIFDYISDSSKKIIPVNVPMTSPLPENIEVGISGFPKTDEKIAKPKELEKYLNSINYEIDPASPKDSSNLEKYNKKIFTNLEKRFTVAERLIEKEWDIFFLMFTGDARLQHFTDDKKTINNFYKKTDEFIGNLLEKIDDDVEIMIISDHGFSSLDTEFNLYKWLKKEKNIENNINVNKKTLYNKLENSLENSDIRLGGAYRGNIYVKDEELREEIRENLSNLHFNGKKVFRDVLSARSLYGDNNGPEIIPVPRRGFNHKLSEENSLFTRNNFEKKTPDREGILLTSFEIIEGHEPESIDVAPTILEILSIKNSNLEGKPMIKTDKTLDK